MIDLEARVKDLETKNAELEERVSNLQNENQMLRQVIFESLNIVICVILLLHNMACH